MALAITSSNDYNAPPGSAVRTLIIQYNAFLAEFRVLCVKLDADTGVAGTDYTASIDGACSLIGNTAGTAITA